jgi:hypothetical protein
MSRVNKGEEGSNPSEDRWWIPIGIVVALVPIVVVLGLVAPPDAFYALFTTPVTLLGYALTLVSPLFVYLDKQYIESVSTWTPSSWYYLMPFPPLTFLSIVYIYQRHKYVGVP